MFCHLRPESGNVRICKLQCGYGISLTGKVKAVLTSTGTHIQDLRVGSQILFDIPNGCQEFHSGCLRFIQTVSFTFAAIDFLHKSSIAFCVIAFHKMFGFTPITTQNCIMIGITNTLVVSVRSMGCSFVFHAALSHNSAGIRIIGIVSCCYTVHTNFFKEILNNGG